MIFNGVTRTKSVGAQGWRDNFTAGYRAARASEYALEVRTRGLTYTVKHIPVSEQIGVSDV